MDNIKHSTKCPTCGQSAWRRQGGKLSCIPCGYRTPTSLGMCAGSEYATNHPTRTQEDIPNGHRT